MEKTRYHGVIIISVVLLSIATVFGSYFISKTNFTIQNTGTTTTMDGKLTNTISVQGDGKVYAAPDMVTITVSASELAKTTKEAQSKVNDKINEVLKILKDNNIPDKDVQTSNLSLYPEYDWSITPKYLKGQRATQGLTINIKGIDPKAEKVSNIIDDISQINNIELGGITFDIEDKTPYFSQARELAFKKAKQKADELSKLGGVELLKPVSIADATVDYYPPMYSRNQYFADTVQGAGESGQIPTGQLEINIRLDVMWGIK